MRIKFLCILKDKVVEIPVSKIKNGKKGIVRRNGTQSGNHLWNRE